MQVVGSNELMYVPVFMQASTYVCVDAFI